MENPCLEIKKRVEELLKLQTELHRNVGIARETRKTAAALKSKQEVQVCFDELKADLEILMDTPEFTRKNVERICTEPEIDSKNNFNFRISAQNDLQAPMLLSIGSGGALWLRNLERILTHPRNRVSGLQVPAYAQDQMNINFLISTIKILANSNNRIKRLNFETKYYSNDALERLAKVIVSPTSKVESLDLSHVELADVPLEMVLGRLGESTGGKLKKLCLFGISVLTRTSTNLNRIYNNEADTLIDFIKSPNLHLKELGLKNFELPERLPELQAAAKARGIKLTIGE